jgi:hypothetical protein
VPPRRRDDEEDEHDEDKPQRSEDVERGARLLRKKESKVTLLVWVVALVLAGVSGTAVYISQKRQNEQRAVEQAHKDSVQALWAQMLALDISTDEGAQQMILLADEKKDLWSRELIAGDVTSRRAKAATNLQISAERKSLRDRLAAIETALADLESLSADQLAEQRRNIEELELAARVELVGAEFLAKLGTLRTSSSRTYAQKLLDEAKTAGRENPSRESLAIFSRAEEEIQRLFDKAIKDKDTENSPFFEQLYRETIKSSDALSLELFTPELIEKTPEIDLLNGEWASKWQRAEVQGFEHRIEGGTLHITGPAADTNKKGVLAIGLGEKWRDFVLSIEFTLDSGSPEFFFRMRDKPDGGTESFVLSTEGAGAVMAGEQYKAEFSLIGSQFVYRELESLDGAVDASEISWTKSRWGALCLVIPDGTQLKISRLRMRLLR